MRKITYYGQMIDIQKKYLTWLKIERNASPHTVTSYQRDLEDFISFLSEYDALSVSDANRISRFSIRAWMGTLSDKGLTKSSIARKVSTLRSFFKFAFSRGYIKDNPAALVQIPKKEKILPKSLITDDIEAMFEALGSETVWDIQSRAILELFYATGIRLSELIGLNVRDIDFHQSQIRVMGKGAKERIIPFNEKAAAALKAWLEARPQLIFQKMTKIDSGAVFLTKKGKRIYPVAVQRLVKQCIEKVSEASKTSPHVLRHSFATHLLNKGADIRIIKELMGHANLTATQVYTSTSVERLKNIYENSHPRGKL